MGGRQTYLLRCDECLCRGSGEGLRRGLLGAGPRWGRQQGRREAGFRLVEAGGRGAGGAVGGGALGEAAVQRSEAPLFQRSRQLCRGTHRSSGSDPRFYRSQGPTFQIVVFSSATLNS